MYLTLNRVHISADQILKAGVEFDPKVVGLNKADIDGLLKKGAIQRAAPKKKEEKEGDDEKDS